MVSEERAAELLAENAELRERIAEIARDAQEAIEDNSQMAAIFEADDQLASAMAEIKRLKAEVVSLKEQLAGAIGTRNKPSDRRSITSRSAKRWLRDDVQPFPRCAAVRDGDFPDAAGHFRKRRTGAAPKGANGHRCQMLMAPPAAGRPSWDCSDP